MINDLYSCCGITREKNKNTKKYYYVCDLCCKKIHINENPKKKPCGHVYHNHCIEEWLKFNIIQCPCCYHFHD